ncbi:hypothetical protein M0R88_15305 [Halorussus gelatinilyticus]|uniref:Uncharacterized protein n=1 Tax=Halorussus gelatinilyticus TaxID=2937524 RepID=A0A8U0IHX2_9EURY|nr:hypothetical protein [Halorussus gelatinilyticus]UPV99873.1 hypothetical protein M0R88_15305 [Halorussus gelatinilyticus]
MASGVTPRPLRNEARSNAPPSGEAPPGSIQKDYNLALKDGERDVLGGNNGVTDDHDAFLQMASEFPVRTSIYTFGLPVFAVLQLINGFVHDGSLELIGLFAVLMVAFSVKLTLYHVAIYRRQKVDSW